MTKTVLILGGRGKIGLHSTRAFQTAGWDVRQFDRSRDDMTRSAMGADVIVNGLNPPNYHNWAALIPAITRDVIAAARASGATVIIPGNVYNFGVVNGPIDASTPQIACSGKGRIRVEMERAYRDAGVPTINLRAGTFIDPDRNNCVMSQIVLAKAAKGKITQMGDPDVIQPYAYLPDWARAAVILAEKRDQLARFEDIPFAGHSFTLRDLQAELSRALQREMLLSRFPWWLMPILSPVVEVIRELREMRYLADMPHWLDGTKFDQLLPDFQPTPLRDVMLAALPADVHPDQMVRSGKQAVFA